ncbi:hypothetical protein V5F77_01110 [Xanthobacter sp. DSM 24535]|uniref:hypothetical protein n=1 Tax=Roseixanthobacter psychrophilus TaxID=3119917 RepID=UPI003729C880
MQVPASDCDYPSGPRWWLALLACVVVVMGAKLSLIWLYGSSVPYWDQWNAEGALLYKPYLEGHVPLANLIALHNEHRVLMTRLLDLLLLEASGRWDPILQMCVNAAIHTACGVVVIVLLRRMVSASATIALTAFVALLLAVPFGWENTLAGFQSSFYLALLFSVLSLWLLATAEAFDVRWFFGALFSLIAFFSVGAGACTPIVAGVMVAAQAAVGRRRGWREWAGIGVLFVFGAVLLALVPSLPQHASLKAQSLLQFLEALQSVASWPLPPSPITPLLLYAPLIWLTVRVLMEKRPISDPAWLCIGIGGWVAMQGLSLAYGRAQGVGASRYLDMTSVGLMANFVAIAALLRDRALTLPRRAPGLGFAAAWLVIVALGLGHIALTVVPTDVITRGQQGKMQADNVRQFLGTGDFSALANKPFLQVPYPDAERLRQFLMTIEIRGILPEDILDEPATHAAMRARLSSSGMFAGAFWTLRTWAPFLGPYIAFAGIALYFLAGLSGPLVAAPRLREEEAASPMSPDAAPLAP